MDAFFTPTTRYVDLYAARAPGGAGIPEDFKEVELSGDCWSAVIQAAVDWKDFLAHLENHMVWLSPDCFITVEEAYAGTGFDIGYHYLFAVKDVFKSWLQAKDLKVYAASEALATHLFEGLFQILANSESPDVILSCHDGSNMIPTPGRVVPEFVIFPVPGAVLERYISGGHDADGDDNVEGEDTTAGVTAPHLRNLRMEDMTLCEEHVRALNARHADLELALSNCKLTVAGKPVFVEALGRNLGPTQLLNCKLEISVLADAVRGNTTSLKSLKPCGELNHDHLSEADFQALAAACEENKGLVTLDLAGQPISEDSWRLMLESLEDHPTMIELDLHLTPSSRRMTAATKQERMRAIVNLLDKNTVMQKIHMLPHECDPKILKDEIQPRLLTNRHRPRVRALNSVEVDSYRRKLFSQALCKVRNNKNLVWLLLSANKDMEFGAQADVR